MEHATWCRRRLFVGFVTLKGICLLGPTENAVFHKVASWEYFAWVLSRGATVLSTSWENGFASHTNSVWWGHSPGEGGGQGLAL